jgi:cyanate permease
LNDRFFDLFIDDVLMLSRPIDVALRLRSGFHAVAPVLPAIISPYNIDIALHNI